MPAPTLTAVRSGVQFTPAAAASFRRAEHGWGRRIDVNSTYRDWDLQMSWYRAWNAYVAGDAPHPGHSRAIHPNLSAHCKGLGLDSDDWTRPGFIKLMAEHGWIRTAANDPTERHHFEYQSWRDQHVGELAGGNITPIIPELDKDEAMQICITDNEGRYGVKNRYYWTFTGQAWYPATDIPMANRVAAYLGKSAYDCKYYEWEWFKATAPSRTGAVVQGGPTAAEVAAEVAKLIPAATGAPTAAENAAEVIRQMKLPGN